MALLESALKRELGTFQKHKDELLSKELGRHVVIFGDRIVGCYDTYEDALWAGYDQVGTDDPFLIRKIEPERTHFIYRGSLTKC